MIVEMVTCDYCDTTETMRQSTVPDDWWCGGGQHFCTWQCAVEVWGGAE